MNRHQYREVILYDEDVRSFDEFTKRSHRVPEQHSSNNGSHQHLYNHVPEIFKKAEHQHNHHVPEVVKKVHLTENHKVVRDGEVEVYEEKKSKTIDIEADGFIQEKHKSFELCKWDTFKAY